MDTKEGRELCEELELTWKYQKLGITLSPDCKGIFQDMKALKVISPAVSEDILLAEAVFAHNSQIRKGTELSPFQLVTGKQSEPPLVDDTGKLTYSSINRLKHLGVQAQEKENGDPQEVTNQHTSPSLVVCLVGIKDSPGSSHKEEIIGAELIVKGNSQQVYNSKGARYKKKNFKFSIFFLAPFAQHLFLWLILFQNGIFYSVYF